jgi:hypothetical protein
MSEELTDKLRSLNVGQEMLRWCGDKTVLQLWNDCPRGDWLLHLLGKTGCVPDAAARKKLVKCMCACVRCAHSHISVRAFRWLETAESWVADAVSVDEILQAKSAINDLMDAVSDDYAVAAVIYAIISPEEDISNYAYAAAAYAVAVPDSAAERGSVRALIAAAVREAYPDPPEILSPAINKGHLPNERKHPLC